MSGGFLNYYGPEGYGGVFTSNPFESGPDFYHIRKPQESWHHGEAMITTNTWTLGPDLDPWLFERYAEIIVEKGSLPAIDMTRNVPLGFDTSIESQLLPRMISWIYNFLHFFNSDVSVMYAAVIFPVIMFALTIIVFFLFVREVFIKKDKKSRVKANIIAIISTFFMIV